MQGAPFRDVADRGGERGEFFGGEGLCAAEEGGEGSGAVSDDVLEVRGDSAALGEEGIGVEGEVVGDGAYVVFGWGRAGVAFDAGEVACADAEVSGVLAQAESLALAVPSDGRAEGLVHGVPRAYRVVDRRVNNARTRAPRKGER